MDGERPIVTFDMDGVLCRQPFGINPGKGHGKRRDRPGRRNILWFTERWRYFGRKPMPGARPGFLSVAEFAECIVVSARAEHARGLTERWFARYFGFVPELHLRPSWRETSAQFKVRKLQELGPVAHFEDDPHTAEWLSEFLPKVLLVDWARNRWLEGPNITRISRVSEALPALAAAFDTERHVEPAAEADAP